MRVIITWETHNRRYSISLVEFLKNMDIIVTDEQVKATARKLLEQKEAKPEE